MGIRCICVDQNCSFGTLVVALMTFFIFYHPLPRFYGVLMGSVCALYLLPLYLVFLLLNNVLFLGNVAFYRGKKLIPGVRVVPLVVKAWNNWLESAGPQWGVLLLFVRDGFTIAPMIFLMVTCVCVMDSKFWCSLLGGENSIFVFCSHINQILYVLIRTWIYLLGMFLISWY